MSMFPVICIVPRTGQHPGRARERPAGVDGEGAEGGGSIC